MFFAFITFFAGTSADVEEKPETCMVQYANFNTSWEPLINICRDKIKVNLKDHPIYSTTSDFAVEEFDFDDKCYVHCLYQGMNLLTDAGQLDKSKTESIFDANVMSEEIYYNAMSIWNECIDDAESIGRSREMDNCKVLATHAYCVEMDLGSHIYDCTYPHSLH